jgi:hypothetical protein
MKILIKTLSGLMPGDPDSETWYQKIKVGTAISVETHTIRNYQFLKKYFALLKIGYDNWNPGKINSKYGEPKKNFERFRKDIAILSGHFEIVIRLDGTSRPEADSISFAKMSEEDFEKLYNETINIFLDRIYDKDMTSEKLDEIVTQYLSFA